MPKLPAVKHRELIRVLEKCGFEEIRQTRSHRRFVRKLDSRKTTVPIHNKDLGQELLHKIIEEVGLSEVEFKQKLKE